MQRLQFAYRRRQLDLEQLAERKRADDGELEVDLSEEVEKMKRLTLVVKKWNM